MQATADTAETNVPATDTEQRPVRLLVPTGRRSDYFLSEEDTLRASDLGITRDTTDKQIDAILAETDSTEYTGYRQTLIKLRDGLRHPRDIREARAWGFIVPEDENSEELSADPKKRLGWWWVYDPNRTETRAERRTRYLEDERLIDTKGFARVTGRAYITTKDRKFAGDTARRMIRDPGFRHQRVLQSFAEAKLENDGVDLKQLMRDRLAERSGMNAEQVKAELLAPVIATILEETSPADIEQAETAALAKAKEDVLSAMPERRVRAGQSDMWHVSDAVKSGRDLTQLDEWYERNTIKQTGRPRGARTKNRRPKTAATTPSKTTK